MGVKAGTALQERIPLTCRNRSESGSRPGSGVGSKCTRGFSLRLGGGQKGCGGAGFNLTGTWKKRCISLPVLSIIR
jgi:hypothetical protein